MRTLRMAPSGSALTRFDCTQFLYYNLLEIYMGASSCLGLTEKKRLFPEIRFFHCDSEMI